MNQLDGREGAGMNALAAAITAIKVDISCLVWVGLDNSPHRAGGLRQAFAAFMANGPVDFNP
jgi:hypothetical protein